MGDKNKGWRGNPRKESLIFSLYCHKVSFFFSFSFPATRFPILTSYPDLIFPWPLLLFHFHLSHHFHHPPRISPELLQNQLFFADPFGVFRFVCKESIFIDKFHCAGLQVLGPGLKIGETRQGRLESLVFKSNLQRGRYLCVTASYGPAELTQEPKVEKMETTAQDETIFDGMKQHFLQFKKEKYLGQPELYENLAKARAPKFLVIACADSRVCPSNILGFQPGDAFIVRNVANLVPPVENGTSETKAALEFSVNTLKVQNILVVGHSCCGGIRALMGMEDNKVDSSSFIHSWVITGKNAKINTKSAASNLSFDQQCRHCEKESINRSLENLLGYPWIKEKVIEGSLCLHGGYYNFVDCTFEKWTLDCSKGDGYSIKNREFWS